MKHSEIDFRYTMTFSQCVHGMYDEKMEAVYRKCSQNASFEEDSESTFYILIMLRIHTIVNHLSIFFIPTQHPIPS